MRARIASSRAGSRPARATAAGISRQPAHDHAQPGSSTKRVLKRSWGIVCRCRASRPPAAAGGRPPASEPGPGLVTSRSLAARSSATRSVKPNAMEAPAAPGVERRQPLEEPRVVSADRRSRAGSRPASSRRSARGPISGDPLPPNSSSDGEIGERSAQLRPHALARLVSAHPVEARVQHHSRHPHDPLVGNADRARLVAPRGRSPRSRRRDPGSIQKRGGKSAKSVRTTRSGTPGWAAAERVAHDAVEVRQHRHDGRGPSLLEPVLASVAQGSGGAARIAPCIRRRSGTSSTVQRRRRIRL